MVKKAVRKITASEDVAVAIDAGAKADKDLKNLTYRDKGYKAKITSSVEEGFEVGESSIRMEGEESAVLVSRTEKVELDVSAESFDVVKQAVKDGVLDGVVEVKRSVQVPTERVLDAVRILTAAGISATSQENFTVNPAAFREFEDEGSPERASAKTAMESCTNTKTSFRVKYE